MPDDAPPPLPPELEGFTAPAPPDPTLLAKVNRPPPLERPAGAFGPSSGDLGAVTLPEEDDFPL